MLGSLLSAGYRGATTVEQIAEATGSPPSTFFRYFPADEDTILSWIRCGDARRGDRVPPRRLPL